MIKYSYLVIALLLIPMVQAEYDVFPVELNPHDYYYNSISSSNVHGSSLLYATKNNAFLPAVTQIIYINFNTSDLPDNAIITSADMTYYINSYASSGRPTPTKIYYIVFNSSSTSGTLTYSRNGWETYSLTSTNINSISKTGMTNTQISVNDPGSGKSRQMSVRAREYFPSGFSAYLNVTYTLPGDEPVSAVYAGEHYNPINKHIIKNECKGMKIFCWLKGGNN